HLLGTGVGGDGRKWRTSTQLIARLTKPHHGVRTTFEHFHGKRQDARQTRNTIRRCRIESSVPFPASTCSRTHLEQTILLGRRQFQRFGDSFISTQRKPLLNFGEQIDARYSGAEQSFTAQELDDAL